MRKIFTRGDVTITLDISEAGGVVLNSKMEVDYPGIQDHLRNPYPDKERGEKVATVDMQFDFIEAGRNFDAVYNRRKLAHKIKTYREEKGWSQQELADKSGMTRANINRIEGGKYSTGQDILSKIAAVLGKRLDIV